MSEQPKETKATAPAPAAAGGSNASKKDKFRSPKAASAVYLVKGAAAQVLDSTLMIGQSYDSPTKGRIVIEYIPAEKPTDDVLREIEAAANFKIKEDLEILVETEERAAAEEKYRREPVNKQFIYEKRVPPAQITSLNILTIPGWTVSAVVHTEFEKRTSDVGGIVITKFLHRPAKKELELCFDVVDPKSAPAAQVAVKQAPRPTKNYNDTVAVAKEMINSIVASLEKVGVKLTPEQKAALLAAELAKTESTLNLVKNAAYSTGFAANLKK